MLPATRIEFCQRCGRTTRWELADVGVPKYMCVGEDRRHPELKVHGCGRTVEATEFLSKRGGKR